MLVAHGDVLQSRTMALRRCRSLLNALLADSNRPVQTGFEGVEVPTVRVV